MVIIDWEENQQLVSDAERKLVEIINFWKQVWQITHNSSWNFFPSETFSSERNPCKGRNYRIFSFGLGIPMSFLLSTAGVVYYGMKSVMWRVIFFHAICCQSSVTLPAAVIWDFTCHPRGWWSKLTCHLKL